MSATAPATRTSATAPAPSRPASASERQRPPLVVVRPRRSAAARAPFILLVTAILALGLVCLLLLNTALSQGAFEHQQLAANVKALTDKQQALRQSISGAAEPNTLAANALTLGLVPSKCTVFLQVPTGKVLGTPCAAPAPVVRAAPKKAKPESSNKKAAGEKVAGSAATPKAGTKAGTKSGAKAGVRGGANDAPTSKSAATNPATGKPATAKPATAKPTTQSTPEKPVTAKPTTKRPAQKQVVPTAKDSR